MALKESSSPSNGVTCLINEVSAEYCDTVIYRSSRIQGSLIFLTTVLSLVLVSRIGVYKKEHMLDS
jgi:hypothetical protein